MCPERLISFSFIAIAGWLSGCGGDLALPDDGAAAVLRIVSGDAQEAQVGTELPQPLVVAVSDAKGGPVSGAEVRFRFVEQGFGSAIDPVSPQTDDHGLAVARAQFGPTPGAQIVEASLTAPAAGEARVRFTLTATGNPGGPGGGGGGAEGPTPPGDAGGGNDQPPSGPGGPAPDGPRDRDRHQGGGDEHHDHDHGDGED
jgi:hypothetical protein